MKKQIKMCCKSLEAWPSQGQQVSRSSVTANASTLLPQLGINLIDAVFFQNLPPMLPPTGD